MIWAFVRRNPRVAGAGVVVLALVLSYGAGRWHANSAWEEHIAEVEAAREAAAERSAALAEKLEQSQAARRAQAEQLDEDARNAPNANRPALSADSVRRLRLDP